VKPIFLFFLYFKQRKQKNQDPGLRFFLVFPFRTNPGQGKKIIAIPAGAVGEKKR
jgi:hypothetical protein